MDYSWFNNGPIPVPEIEESDEETTNSSLPGEGDSPSNDPYEEPPYDSGDEEYDLPEYPGLPDTVDDDDLAEMNRPDLPESPGKQIALLAVILAAVIVAWRVLQ